MRRLGGTLRMTGKALPAMLWGAALLFNLRVSYADYIFDIVNAMYFHEEESEGWSFLSAGSFNTDSHPDFIHGNMLSETEGYFEVFLGNGDGTFESQGHISTNEIYNWAVGDFDNNGFTDVLIMDYGHADTASIYLCIGDGSFSEPVASPQFLECGAYPAHSDVNDFNEDGYLDVALTSHSDSFVLCFGYGDGTFYRAWDYEPYVAYGAITSGDLDQDGWIDLVLLDLGCFLVFHGNGSVGVFDAPVIYDGSWVTGVYIRDVVSADINEDGWLDIIISDDAGYNNRTIFIFLNQGDGTFLSEMPYYWWGQGFNDLFLHDFNLDGHLDLGAGFGSGGETLVLAGDGNGSFNFIQPLWWTNMFQGSTSVVDDYDYDGDADIAIVRKEVSQYPPGIYVLSNETIQQGVEGGEAGTELLSLTPSSNPFISSVTITCEGSSLPGQLMVYDITGRLIRSLSDRQGSSFVWDGREAAGDQVPAGTYLIQGAIDGQVSSIRVVRL